MPIFAPLPYSAAFYNSDGDALATGNPGAGLHANSLTMLAAGLPADSNGRPTSRLLAAVSAMTSAQRAEITTIVAAVLAENGIRIDFDLSHPSTPLVYWRDDTSNSFTLDDFMVVKIRGPQNHAGLIEPAGNGFRGVKDGRAPTAVENAAQEMKQETGLAGDVRYFGSITSVNTLQVSDLKTSTGEAVKGVMPAMSDLSVVRLPDTLATIMAKATPNHESVALGGMHISQFYDYLAGKPVKIPCYVSTAASAQASFAAALAEQSDDVVISHRLLRKVIAGMPRIPGGEYQLVELPVMVRFCREDKPSHAVGRDYLLEGFMTAQAAGCSLGQAEQSLVEAEFAQYATIVQPSAQAALGRRNDSRRPDLGNNG